MDRAAARLELSAGEIACPAKGGNVIAVGRCQANQRETEQAGAACTCPVYTGRGLPLVVEARPLAVVTPASPPPTAKIEVRSQNDRRAIAPRRHLQPVVPDRLAAIRASARRAKGPVLFVGSVVPVEPPAAAPPPPAVEPEPAPPPPPEPPAAVAAAPLPRPPRRAAPRRRLKPPPARPAPFATVSARRWNACSP